MSKRKASSDADDETKTKHVRTEEEEKIPLVEEAKPGELVYFLPPLYLPDKPYYTWPITIPTPPTREQEQVYENIINKHKAKVLDALEVEGSRWIRREVAEHKCDARHSCNTCQGHHDRDEPCSEWECDTESNVLVEREIVQESFSVPKEHHELIIGIHASIFAYASCILPDLCKLIEDYAGIGHTMDLIRIGEIYDWSSDIDMWKRMMRMMGLEYYEWYDSARHSNNLPCCFDCGLYKAGNTIMKDARLRQECVYWDPDLTWPPCDRQFIPVHTNSVQVGWKLIESKPVPETPDIVNIDLF